MRRMPGTDAFEARDACRSQRLLDSGLRREQGTEDAQADARRIRLHVRGKAVADDLEKRLELEGGGLVRAEAQKHTAAGGRDSHSPLIGAAPGSC
jgi:hypothetical protein